MRSDCRFKKISTDYISLNDLKPAPAFSGFSLLEMLVVIGLIALLTAMTLPSLKGLLGVGGRAGGASMVQSALEQARLAAVESGESTYVGFPFEVEDQEAAFSSLILFREATPDELAAGKTIVPLSRWLKLPPGIYLQAGTNFAAGTMNMTVSALATSIPQLVTSGGALAMTNLTALAFDRFGKLKRAQVPVDVRVGEKIGPTNSFQGFDDNFIELTIQPLTGRVRVVDRGKGSGS